MTDYRHNLSVTIAVRQSNDIDYYSTSVESLTLHFPLDILPDDEAFHTQIADGLVRVMDRWKNKIAQRAAQKIINESTPQELAKAIELIRSNKGTSS